MNNLLKTAFGDKSSSPSLINNPFRKDCITRIEMVMRKRLFTGELVFESIVRFENGSTSAIQEIEADNLPDLYMKTAEFCMNL